MSWMRGWTALAMALMVSSCGTMKAPPPPLRVGVTPNYPPIIMLAGQKAAGVECDFAVQLASELGRPLELMPVPWDLQMDELEAGRTDIVMSGLTVTMARQARVAFCEPYMDNPLMAVVRRGESGRFASASADAFVRRKCPNGKILPLATRDDVVFYLANQRIDLFIDDMAAAVQIVTSNENRLELVPIPLESQQLAWAVRADDVVLLAQANEALARWYANGLLNQILDRWMPYLKKMPVAKPPR